MKIKKRTGTQKKLRSFRNSLRLTALFVVVTLLSLCLCGCRYSEVLEQIIHEKNASSVDYKDELKTVFNQENTQSMNDVMPDITESDDSERYDDSQAELPANGEEESTGLSPNFNYDSESETDQEADNSPSKAENGNGEDGDSEDGDSDSTALSNPNLIDDNSTGSGGTGDEGSMLVGNAGNKGTKYVVDKFGRAIEVPEDVSRVSAVGDTAGIIALLAGTDSLVATSTDFTENEVACRIFSGLNSVPALWNGDGSAGMTSQQFEDLLKLKPEVCIEISGQSVFSEEQATRLNSQGIAYLVLPEITDFDSLKNNVRILGNMFDSSVETDGKAPSERAEEYIEWAQSLLDEVGKATAESSELNTMYIDDWEEDASYRIYNEKYTTLSGRGVAVVKNKECPSCAIINNLFSFAGVTNVTNAAEAIRPRKLYFIPLVALSRSIKVDGDDADELTQQRLMDVGGGLGTNQFPAVIAGNQKTAQGIRGSECWKNYGLVYNKAGTFSADGFLDEDGTIVSTQVSDDYKIYVNPHGVSAWNSGSCESVLEAYWIAATLKNTYNQQQVRDKINEFYTLFYDYELDETQMDVILAGAEE